MEGGVGQMMNIAGLWAEIGIDSAIADMLTLGALITVIYALKDKIRDFLISGVEKRIEELRQTTDRRFNSVELDTVRLQLLNLIYHSPENDIAIKECYGKYKKLGGNSYMDSVYTHWEADYDA
jgi:hypothetical protein